MVGAMIRAARMQLGLSQRQLVKRVNNLFRGKSISRSSLAELERGARGISVTRLHMLMSTLVRLGIK
jgi:transcriptional regulator with XRE-family HTH domain